MIVDLPSSALLGQPVQISLGPCPHCTAPLGDAASSFMGSEVATPADGDVTCCQTCAGLVIYQGPDDRKTMNGRLPTDEETAELLADPRVATLVAILRFRIKEARAAAGGLQ